MNVSEKAAKYADGKANEVITKAIAQAYADGYQDGYKDKEAEIPAEFQDDKTKFVDLGLPSGTLWAEDYECVDGIDLFLPHGDAQNYSIPTEEQWNELKTCCEWIYEREENNSEYFNWAKCIGPNGNNLTFKTIGYKKADQSSDEWQVYFWIKDESDSKNKKAAHIHKYKWGNIYRMSNELIELFPGYHLPLRIVK